MLNKNVSWECLSEIVKRIKERGNKLFIVRVDTRDVHGHEVNPEMERPFLGEDIDLILITDLFNLMRTSRWCWYKNNDCKYIRLSVDLRSKTCRIQNRVGENITYQQLKYQYIGNSGDT